MKNSFLNFVMVLLLALAASVNAQDQNKITVEQENHVYALSLDDATALALKNNLGIQIAQYDALIARTDLIRVQSIYDLILQSEAAYQDDKNKNFLSIIADQTITNYQTVGLYQKLPVGIDLSVEGAHNRTWSNSPFATSTVAHNSAFGIIADADLGKNFLGIRDRNRIKITQKEVANSEFVSLDDIERELAAVQKTYWDLVAQTEAVDIQKNILRHAKDLYELNKEKIQTGRIEPPELLDSEANYKNLETNIFLVETLWKEKQDVLKLQLDIIEDERLIETSSPMNLDRKDVILSESLKAALENRRDFKRLQNDVTIKGLRLEIDKRNMWPEINVTASLNRNGLGDFKDSLTNITSENNRDIFTGISFSYPLQNRSAKADLKQSDLEKAQSLLRLKQLEKKIVVDVSNKVRNANTLKEIALHKQDIASLQGMKLVEEEKRFKYGRSNTDTLVRFQEDALRANLAALLAKFDYYVSLIELELLQGTLLNRYWEGKF